MSYQFLDIAQNLDLWDETIQIYNDSFPEWEREDTSNILLNVKSGVYKMFSYVEDGVVIGFYILDINAELDYALFSFLAIKEENRGKGIGSKLCLNAIEYFHKNIKQDWFLIEAEDRQAKLYARLGFETIKLDYAIPEFNSTSSVPMNLMLIQEQKALDSNSLALIIKDIFHRGYSLNENDQRIQTQIEKIPKTISLLQ